MTHPDKRSQDFWAKRLASLIGATITKVAVDDSDDFDAFLGLELTLPNKSRKILWLLSDEEGNAPGAFEIDNLPQE